MSAKSKNDLFFEEREISDERALSSDLARHIFLRQKQDDIYIVTDNPVAIRGPLKRQWLRILRRLAVKRSSTINIACIAELSDKIIWVQSLHFKQGLPTMLDDGGRNVIICKKQELLEQPPYCSTLYLCCSITIKEIATLTKNMPDQSVVVIYK